MRLRTMIMIALALVLSSCAADLANFEEEAASLDNLADPTEDNDDIPDGYRFAFPRDQILPIYSPEFVRAAEVDWPQDELVIGVEIDGDARAYPVGFLTRREIVSDLHQGIPTLVSW